MNNSSILDLKLSNRAKNQLIKAGVLTIDDLLALSGENLRKIRGIGELTCDEILKIAEELRKGTYKTTVGELSKTENTSKDLNFIINLPLSIRAKNQLAKSGITTVEELAQLSKAELMSISNLGEKTVDSIISYLESERIIVVSKLYQVVFPQLKEETAFDLFFDDGILVDDISLEEIGFSTRLSNCLRRAGFTSIREVVFADYEKIINTPQFGVQTHDELIDYVKSHVVYNIVGETDIAVANAIFHYYSNHWAEEVPEFDREYFELPLLTAIKKTVAENGAELKTVDDFVDNPLWEKQLFSSQVIVDTLSRYLLQSLKNDWAKIDVLTYAVPEVFVETNAVDDAINNLICNRKAEVDNGLIRKQLPRIEDWLDTLSEKECELISMRLTGQTLEDCGRRIGVTRERARQIIAKALRKAPVFREDDNRYWFENYYLSLEEMKALFEVSPQTYYYYCIRYKKGSKGINEITDDRHLSYEEYKKAEKLIGKDKLRVGVFLVEANREELVKAILKLQYHGETTTVNQLFCAYNNALSHNGISSGSLVVSSERVFAARLPDYSFTLTTYGKKVRYYDFKRTNPIELVEQFHLKQYLNYEISTLKLFRENANLMADYDLKDEYELHNYLKKTYETWKPYAPFVELGRTPTVHIGETNKEKQVEQLLLEVAPISVEAFCQRYEKEYGVLAQTIQANMSQLLEKYIHQGELTVNQPRLDKAEREFLSEKLSNEFYFTEDIKEIYKNQFGESNLERINSMTIREFGFKIYSRYVIKDSYSSADEYFYQLLTNKDKIDLNQMDSRMTNLGSMYGPLNRLRKNYDLLEYDKGKYISFEHFHRIRTDMDKSDLIDYSMQAIEFAAVPFFTVHLLNKNGFKHRVQSVPLGEWFFSSLIKNSEQVRTLSLGGGMLHYFGKTQKSALDLIRYELAIVKTCEVDSFVSMIADKYGLMIPKSKILDYIRQSDMYYDSIMEKVYYSKAYFYKDLE